MVAINVVTTPCVCSQPTAVGRSETFFKYLPFGQSVQRCLLSSPSGHLALLIERWTQGDAALWAARRLRDRAARRWRNYKDTLAAAVKAGQASQRPPGSPPGIPPAGAAKYCAPGLMLGSRAMFARVRFCSTVLHTIVLQTVPFQFSRSILRLYALQIELVRSCMRVLI